MEAARTRGEVSSCAIALTDSLRRLEVGLLDRGPDAGRGGGSSC